MALLGSSRAGLCPCDHAVVEQPTDAPCHGALDHESPAAQRSPGEVCIEQFCPHCSSDEPPMLSSLRGIFIALPELEGLAPSGSVERAPLGSRLPDVPFEIFHIPIV